MHWIAFRKIHINNRHGVPGDQPVLLAANHPSAAMEPFLLTIYLDPPIYNMTRGDIFSKPLLRKFLESINMFPVFRKRDGYVEKDRNDGVFEFCIDKLGQGRVVTIYVEGEHKLVKRVRTVQKGIARIAFAAYERQRNEQLQIIPAGCNYAFGDRLRDEVFVNIGKPLLIRDYWEDFQREPNGALLRLCRDIEGALKKVCYHVEDPADDLLAERLLTIFRSDHPQPIWPITVYDGNRFDMEKAVLDRLNALPAGPKERLAKDAEHYFGALEKAGIEDGGLKNPQWASAWWLRFLIAGAIPAFLGWLGNLPISWPVDRVVKTKVKKTEFKITVKIGLGYIIGWLYYPLLLLVALISMKAWLIAGVLLLPLLGWFSWFYRDIWKRWKTASKARQAEGKAELFQLRDRVVEQFFPKDQA